MIDDNLLHDLEDREEEHPAVARLIELGRQKSYVTIDDILTFFPEAEQDVDQSRHGHARQERCADEAAQGGSDLRGDQKCEA